MLAATPRQAGRGTLVLDRSRSAFATPPDAALLRLRLQRQVYLLTLRLTVLRHRLSANSRRESVRTPLRCASPAPSLRTRNEHVVVNYMLLFFSWVIGTFKVSISSREIYETFQTACHLFERGERFLPPITGVTAACSPCRVRAVGISAISGRRRDEQGIWVGAIAVVFGRLKLVVSIDDSLCLLLHRLTEVGPSLYSCISTFPRRYTHPVFRKEN